MAARWHTRERTSVKGEAVMSDDHSVIMVIYSLQTVVCAYGYAAMDKHVDA